MKQTRTATMKSIDIREKLGEPTEIHFNYTGEVFRLGNGSAPSLKMQADQLVDKLNSNTNPDMNPLGYFTKYRFISSEIMSTRSYEIRRRTKIPTPIYDPSFLLYDACLERINIIALSFFNTYILRPKDFPNTIASLDANFSDFPLDILPTASSEERKVLEEWDSERQ
ncbi:MAG: hypothetical protein AABW91_03670 [Nanoarchaeota archaeon]